MTERFFYKDPLAAAWMAKHFGMRFQACTFGLVGRILADDGRLNLETGLGAELYTWRIHPDSLHLLEPQEGDVLRGDEHTIPQIRFMDVPDAQQMGAGAALIRRGFKIIQRNGIAFMWPEKSAA